MSRNSICKVLLRFMSRFPYNVSINSKSDISIDLSWGKSQEEIFSINSRMTEQSFQEIEQETKKGNFYLALHKLELLREKMCSEGYPGILKSGCALY